MPSILFGPACLVICCLLLGSLPARTADTPTLSTQTYQVLQTTQEWLERGQTAKAVQRLESLVKETAKRPYEQAVVLQSLAYAQIEREDYPAAIPALKRSIELETLPLQAQQQSRYHLAQLYMATEQFAAAIEQLGRWFEQAESAPAEAYVLLGSAHLQLNQYRQAIGPLRRAIELSKQPNEGWYQSLLGAYYEAREYAQAVKLLRRMLHLFPANDAYWRQLAGLELLRERFTEALAVMELAYLNGRLKNERDLLNLAQLYIQRNAPYKAAQLLENQLEKGRIQSNRKTWEQTANAWQLARELERSIVALERALAFERQPELTLRLARLYLEVDRWNEAEQTLRRFLQTAKGKHTDQAWLLLGIAYLEGASAEAAKQAFGEALKSANTHDQAKQWLDYLQ
jgi:tetratricopeptide (TPR) repeat protein